MQNLDKTVLVLKGDNIILYPTDTVWGIGCDATNEIAVDKVYKIKQRDECKSLIILVNSFKMLSNYVEVIPKKVKTYLDKTNQPTTVIYNKPKNLASNVIATNNTIAIRIVNSGFAFELLNKFEKPIVSTSANVSGEPTPKTFKEISKKIIKKVDFVVNQNQEESTCSSSKIIKFVNDKIKILRD